MIDVYFDGVKLTEYFNVLRGFQRNIGSEWENELIENTFDGSRFKRNRITEKNIPVPFVARYDLNSKRRELARILNVKEPKTLMFSDEPNVYYEAIIDGGVDLDEIVFLGKGTLNFLVPDGIAHSTQTKLYTATNNSFAIDNQGTYKSYPILEATMPAENGVVAFINDRGKILQFGNPSEDDTRGYTVSERVIWDTAMTSALETGRGYKTNFYTFSGQFLGRYTLNTTGTRKFLENYVTYDSMGTGNGMQGLSYGRKVSADSEGVIGATDFECREKVWFEIGTPKQTGLMLRELRDSTGKAICSVAFYKVDTTSTEARIRINVLGNVKEWKFIPNGSNIYTKKGKEFSIVKSGNTINFHLGGVTNGGFVHTVRLDALKTLIVTDVVDYFGVPAGGTPVTRMCLMSSTLRKDNVSKIADVKNLYGAGDVLKVDTASGAVTINDLETQLGSLGNDWEEFYLTPGTNEITCVYSDWAQAPTFKLYNQEAYL